MRNKRAKQLRKIAISIDGDIRGYRKLKREYTRLNEADRKLLIKSLPTQHANTTNPV